MKKHWKLLALFLVLALLPLSACASGGAGKGNEEGAGSIVDDIGREVKLSSMEKVAVPQSSFAHMWVLAGGTVYATSEETFAEGIVALEEGTVNIGSVKIPSVETMIAKGVDFAILTSNIAGHVDMREALEAVGIPCAYFEVETFDDYLRVLNMMTDLTGRKDLYKRNGQDVKARVDAAIARGKDRPAPSVLYLRAFSSGVKAKGSDSLTGAMLKDLGCVNIADGEDALLEDVSMEVIIDRDPDFIFVTTMGASSEAALEALANSLQANPAWAELSAVQNGRYVVLPKDLFHLKPNDRWGESYEMLADILYGQA